MESSSDKISVSGSECQGKPNLSRSFEESRPRSLEMDMNIGTGTERDSPLSKEGYRRGHRLSLQPGQKMSNYLKFLQELAIRQASGGSMASQLFSTAVISGSSSVPNLGAGSGACPETAGGAGSQCKADLEVAAVWRSTLPHWEIGEDGTPTIRPLET